MKNLILRWASSLAVLTAGASIAARCQVVPAADSNSNVVAVSAVVPAPQSQSDLIIDTASDLPDAFPHTDYQVFFHAHGGVPPLHWKLEKGAFPPGMMLLLDAGVLRGQPDRSGEFRFTISVTDSGQPQQAVQKEFTLRVRSGLTLDWSTPAHVNGNRIEGSVAVSNASPYDMDLTFDVKAVTTKNTDASSTPGRATEIGYQHFVLKRGTTKMELPFGETLPYGGYMIYVNVVGEVASKNLIYTEKMQTPHELHVTVGP
jgi:hypothetical protein